MHAGRSTVLLDAAARLMAARHAGSSCVCVWGGGGRGLLWPPFHVTTAVQAQAPVHSCLLMVVALGRMGRRQRPRAQQMAAVGGGSRQGDSRVCAHVCLCAEGAVCMQPGSCRRERRVAPSTPLRGAYGHITGHTAQRGDITQASP